MRTAVLGHVEWVDFLRVPHLPRPGEIVRAEEAWEEPAGGGGVAAGELARLAGRCTLYTALGHDERGARTRELLPRIGVRVAAATRPVPQRRAVTFVETGSKERTITVAGERIAALAADPLPWHELAGTAAVYVCAGEAAAIRLARRAGVVVATARILPVLQEAAIPLDALVWSADDPAETYRPGDLDPPPRLVVRTEGGEGGTFVFEGGPVERYRTVPLPGAAVDSYGCGDSFAAGLAFGLGRGEGPAAALETAARSGAAALARRGAFGDRL